MSKRKVNLLTECSYCGKDYVTEDKFPPTNSPFFPTGYLNICIKCILDIVPWDDLNMIDKFCRYADYAFFIEDYSHLMEEHREQALEKYIRQFWASHYRALGWYEYNTRIMDKMEKGTFDMDIAQLKADELRRLSIKWGAGQSEQDYIWLENYYIDMNDSYDIQTPSHRDYLRKICKISLSMEKEMSKKDPSPKVLKDFGDLMDKMMKSAEFTQAAQKNKAGLTSFSEMAAVLEREGFVPKFYKVDVVNDPVDATIKNMQEFTRDLIMNEHNLHDLVEAALFAAKDPDAAQAYTDNLQEFGPDILTEEEMADHADLDLSEDDEEMDFDNSVTNPKKKGRR